MDIWRKEYTLRRYGIQENYKGYSTINAYTDSKVLLNVQTISNNSSPTEQGLRTTMRLKTFGAFPITTADQTNGTKPDMLYFGGRWYECVSSVFFEHTPLSHYESEFVSVSEAIESPNVPNN